MVVIARNHTSNLDWVICIKNDHIGNTRSCIDRSSRSQGSWPRKQRQICKRLAYSSNRHGYRDEIGERIVSSCSVVQRLG